MTLRKENCPNLSLLCLTLLANSVGVTAVVRVPGEEGKRSESLQGILTKIKGRGRGANTV